jgi:nitrite reductase/ring-hydroxylating ferredoxin subunit
MTDLAEEAMTMTATSTVRQNEPPVTEPAPAWKPPRCRATGDWWAVAAETEIGDRPVAVRLDGRDLALYRDADGVVRAVDDLCPHRRLPMSLGRVTNDGQLQCGYHGWIFDGSSGKCTAIPNLAADEKPAGRIRLPVFHTGSWQGFVVVWSGAEVPRQVPAPALPPIGSNKRGATVCGALEVRAPVALVLDALVVNPGAALGLGPVFGAGEEEAEATFDVDGDVLRVRRVRQTLGFPRVGTFDPFVDHTTATTVAVHLATGLLEVSSNRTVTGDQARLVIGVAPITAHRSAIRWRLAVSGSGGVLLGRAAAALTAVRRLTRHGASLCERVADQSERRRDPATDLLRKLRATTGPTTSVERVTEELT